MSTRKTLLYFGLLLVACFSMGDAAVSVVDSGFETQQEAWTGPGEEPDSFDPDLDAGIAGIRDSAVDDHRGLAPTSPVVPARLSQHASSSPIRAPPAIA